MEISYVALILNSYLCSELRLSKSLRGLCASLWSHRKSRKQRWVSRTAHLFMGNCDGILCNIWFKLPNISTPSLIRIRPYVPQCGPRKIRRPSHSGARLLRMSHSGSVKNLMGGIRYRSESRRQRCKLFVVFMFGVSSLINENIDEGQLLSHCVRKKQSSVLCSWEF